MPLSPSMNVMALLTDAVFMNAGSIVTYPVLARSWPMSMARSSSVPTMRGASSFVSPSVMMALSVTGSSAARACAHYRSKTTVAQRPIGSGTPAPFVQPALVGLRHREPPLLLDEARVRPWDAHVPGEG